MEVPCDFFKTGQEINGVCLMQGEFPKATGEIAIDRMYADNNELKVGDTLKSQRGKQTWEGYRACGSV